jgi:hypothetical protein
LSACYSEIIDFNAIDQSDAKPLRAQVLNERLFVPRTSLP